MRKGQWVALHKIVEEVQSKHNEFDKAMDDIRYDVVHKNIKHINEVIKRLHDLKHHRESIIKEVDRVIALVPDKLKIEWREMRTTIADVNGFIDAMLDLKLEWKKEQKKNKKKTRSKNEC
jgi:hypothetical protein